MVQASDEEAPAPTSWVKYSGRVLLGGCTHTDPGLAGQIICLGWLENNSLSAQMS